MRELLRDFPCSGFEYCEPMVGGGTVYFDQSRRFPTAMINDLNPEVINLYAVVRDNIHDLIDELQDSRYYFHHRDEPRTLEIYHAIRASDPACSVRRAARLLYLNRTCFNGLMRFNRRGGFNAPPGSYRDPDFCRPEGLLAASRYLRGTRIVGPQDASTLIGELGCGCPRLLVIDPPYHSTDSSGFTGYWGRFGEEDQARLVRVVLATGWPFLYTNRATPLVLGMFEGEPGVTLEIRPLRHSIQPVHTTGLVEQELLAHRLRARGAK
jgi:DNA adenine methylase